jgi:quercetin dioxygenase-like cupin family protein
MASKRDRNIPPGVLSADRRTIVNKMMGERAEFRKYSYETEGKTSEITIWVRPGGGPPSHYHTTYAERFTVDDGELIVKLGNAKTITLKAGQSADVPTGVTHTFTAEGDKEVKFHASVIPAHPGFERGLYILYGLSGDDLLTPQGLPKSMIHTALIVDMSDMFFPGAQGLLMNCMVRILAVYGRWSGEEEKLLQKYWD